MFNFLEEFKSFVMRGNLADMAIGFTVGAAFSTFAKSLVNDLIMPPIGLLLGGMDFSDLFIVLKQGTEELKPYATLADAQNVGAVTLNYGVFINNLISLLVIAIAMFFIIRAMNRIDNALEDQFDDPEPTEQTPKDKKCPYCRETINFRATRCPQCTSELESAASGTPAADA